MLHHVYKAIAFRYNVLSIKLRNIVMKKGNTNVNVYVFQKEGVCFFTRIYPG